MNVNTLDWIRANTGQELQKDRPIINYMLKLDNYHLEAIKTEIIKEVKTEISNKQADTIKFINYIVEQRKR